MRRFLAFLFALLAVGPSHAANEIYAVVMIPSHGASATVIDTGPGYTWLLGCGHAYQGAEKNRPMKFDIPRSRPGAAKNISSRLVKVDYQADLSLVLLNDGPVDYVCHVGFVGWREWNHRVYSVGYDEMKKPPQMKPAHIVTEHGTTYYTGEKPWHGRSGGALIDVDRGMLVGVVQGYEIGPGSRGMYVSLTTVQRFLQGVGPAVPPRQSPGVYEQPPQFQRPLYQPQQQPIQFQPQQFQPQQFQPLQPIHYQIPGCPGGT